MFFYYFKCFFFSSINFIPHHRIIRAHYPLPFRHRHRYSFAGSCREFPVKMKTHAKLILLQPFISKKQAAAAIISSSYRLWFLAFISFFTTAAFILSLITAAATGRISDHDVSPTTVNSPLPEPIFNSLIHYASLNSTASFSRMSPKELTSIAAVLRECNTFSTPCNFLVFGFTHETFLWNSINYNGRTIFISDNAFITSKLEERHPEIEAYDVQYTTKVAELYDLLDYSKEQVKNECRPVQNLLFSDCKLAINDLPNHVYHIPWDVILIDGPLGNSPTAPGRISAIYTAGVLARSKKGGADRSRPTHVFVHQIGREMEIASSEEFLCKGNLVESIDSLGHFEVGKMEDNRFEFCAISASSALPPLSLNDSVVDRRTT